MKLLSEIQYKAEEHKRQSTTTQQVTTFQFPEATQATAGREYILTKKKNNNNKDPDTNPSQVPPTETVITMKPNIYNNNLF